MNYKSFDILIVCNGYSQRLSACLYFWEKMNYPKNKYRIIVSTWIKDHETLKVLSKHVEKDILNIAIATNEDSDFHNKGKMIKNSFNLINRRMNEFILMSDADIIFHSETLNEINSLILSSKKEKIISSLREDILENELDIFFKNYRHTKNTDWAWKNLSFQINSPSPFMGWFLSFPSKYLSKINFIESHKGYDTIDWKIYGQLLSMNLKKEIIFFEFMPLHIPHGKKGANWMGVNIEQ